MSVAGQDWIFCAMRSRAAEIQATVEDRRAVTLAQLGFCFYVAEAQSDRLVGDRPHETDKRVPKQFRRSAEFAGKRRPTQPTLASRQTKMADRARLRDATVTKSPDTFLWGAPRWEPCWLVTAGNHRDPAWASWTGFNSFQPDLSLQQARINRCWPVACAPIGKDSKPRRGGVR